MNKIDPYILNELHIYDILRPTITTYGSIKMKEILNYMVVDIPLLTQRQQIITNIKNNKIDDIVEILKEINSMEYILEQWYNNDLNSSNYLFNYNILNKSSVITYYNMFYYNLGIIILIIFILFYLILWKNNSDSITFYNFLLNKNNINLTILSEKTNFIISILLLLLQLCIIIKLIKHCKNIKNNNSIIINNFKKMYYLIKLFDVIYDDDIFLLSEKLYIKDNLKKLTTIFENNNNFNEGQVILIYSNKNEYREDIEKVIQYIGMVDTYITISSMLNMGFKQPVFINNNDGLKGIEIENNIFNGVTVITGEKQSGKTIYMNNILCNIIMAQTIGICPNNIKYVPFDIVLTSHNRSQNNIIDYINDYKYILDNILGNDNKSNILICIDDIFEKINNENECISMIKSFINYLCNQNNNIISFITTNLNLNINHEKIVFKKMNSRYELIDGKSHNNSIFDLLIKTEFNTSIVKNALTELTKITKKKLKNDISK